MEMTALSKILGTDVAGKWSSLEMPCSKEGFYPAVKEANNAFSQT